MNSLERAKKAFWFMVTICIIILAFRMIDIQKDIEELKITKGLHRMSIISTNNWLDEAKDRIDLLEEAMWLEGYEHTEFDSMPHMNNRLLLKSFSSNLMNTVNIQNLERDLCIIWIGEKIITDPWTDCEEYR